MFDRPSTDVKFAQLAKALVPISVNVAGRYNFVIFVELKALAPIVVRY